MKFRASAWTMLFTTSLALAQVAGDIPAYHKTPPAKGQTLAPILTTSELASQGYAAPVQVAAYRAAAKKPALMYQLPCYCYCDRHAGHTSLHTCFESGHGAACGVCMGEALYAYKMSKQGWTAKQIRDGIIKGEFRQMDLSHPDRVM